MEKPSAKAKAWMLAVPAILNTLNTAGHDHLGGGPKGTEWQRHALAILKNSWGIESREALASMIDWLRTEGTNAEYQEYLARFPSTSAEERAADRKLAFIAQHGDVIGDRGLLAWDLCRVVSLAGWGALSGVCSEEDAWIWIVPACKRLQRAYKSWDDLGEGYTLGCAFWGPTHEKGCRDAIAKLQVPTSPWRTIPWSTNIDETVADEANAAWKAGLVKKAIGMLVSAMVAIFAGFVVLLLGIGLVGYIAYKGAFAGLAPPDKLVGTSWDGASTLVCAGHDDMYVSNVTTKLAQGPAISASEHCTIHLDNVDVTAPTALDIEGNAHVIMTGGRLSGSDAAIDGRGNGTIDLTGTKLEGPTRKTQNVTVNGP